MFLANDYSLLKHNTFGIDVLTKTFVEYCSEEELCSCLSSLLPQKILHIGQGSNLLFTRNFEGVVLHSAICTIDMPRETEDTTQVLLRVGGGVVFDDLINYAIDHELYGLENLSYIPGEVGASAVQNVGAYGVEAKDVIERVEAIDLQTGQKREFSNTECQYAYRQSIFKKELRGRYAITYVTFRLSRVFRPSLEYGGLKSRVSDIEKLTARQLRNIIISMRQSKLPEPSEMGSAGSFFINPVISSHQFEQLQQLYPDIPHFPMGNDTVKVPAGWLIEQCGWKGRSYGHAGVYAKQALVLVNLGGATGQEVLELAHEVCKSVQEKFAIKISPEVNVF